jgi:hypothetical protein
MKVRATPADQDLERFAAIRFVIYDNGIDHCCLFGVHF